MRILKMVDNRYFKVFCILLILLVILAPNGFFTGHRTVSLQPVKSISKPTEYIAGDLRLVKGTITGVVRTMKGMPVSGAMVTAFNEANTRRVTVYTQANGRYSLPTTFIGKVTVRARSYFFDDLTLNIRLGANGVSKVTFNLKKTTNMTSFSNRMTASAHAATIHWKEDEKRTAFVSQCNYCHQVGNSLTRTPRSRKQWHETINRMEGYFAMLTDSEHESIVDALSDAFTGKPIKAVQTWDVSPELAKARVEEWITGDGQTFIHDADIGRDGRLYGADEGHDIIWILNRITGKIDQVKLPDVDLPTGGKFSAMVLPIGVFTGKHGPHSITESDDGRLWITNSLSSRLMAYRPEDNSFETFDIGADSLYLHTIRKDLKGRLWFTVAISNRVGRFDPATNQLDLLDLPAGSFGVWLADAMLPTLLNLGAIFFPYQNVAIKFSHHKWEMFGRKVAALPYGIDVNPIDGSIWYTKLNGNKIGHIDPETFEIQEYDTPLSGPRRPRFDKNGILWIPAFDDSALLRFDPKTKIFKKYPLPTLAPGEYETPYALNVHPQTGVIWLTSNMSDRIFSFDPKTAKFVSYPLPTRVSFLRDIVFTKDGKICSSHSNLPSYAIEGGKGGFICLDPGTNK